MKLLIMLHVILQMFLLWWSV